MADLLTRRPGRSSSGRERPVPVVLAATTTTLWAAAVGLAPVAVVVLLAWVTAREGQASALDAVRAALAGWLLACGVPVQTPAGTLGLAPLAVTVLLAWQLARAARSTARACGATGVHGAVRVVGAVGLVHGVVATLVAALVASGPLGVHPGRALVAAGALGAGSALGGVLALDTVRAEALERLPAPVARALPAGGAAAAVVVAAGALLAAGAVAGSAGRATELVGALDPGVVGTVALLLLCVAYAPTAAVWGASYAAGPGFAVGTGTSVGVLGVTLGPLPAVPLLAGLPADAAPLPVRVVLEVPVMAGFVAGVLVARPQRGRPARDQRPPADRRALVVAALLAGPVAGAVLAVLARAASGPLGDGRLAVVGPSPWRVGLLCAVEVSAAAVVSVVLTVALRRRRTGGPASRAARAAADGPAPVEVEAETPGPAAPTGRDQGGDAPAGPAGPSGCDQDVDAQGRPTGRDQGVETPAGPAAPTQPDGEAVAPEAQ